MRIPPTAFTIYDLANGGSQAGPTLTHSATAITNGLFTVTMDFGNQFPGANRWLEISVRTNGGGAFNTLVPRQSITPAPDAIFAENVGSGGLAAGTYGNAVTFNNLATERYDCPTRRNHRLGLFSRPVRLRR